MINNSSLLIKYPYVYIATKRVYCVHFFRILFHTIENKYGIEILTQFGLYKLPHT